MAGRLIAALLAWWLAVAAVAAPSAEGADTVAPPVADNWRVSLITCGPGPEIYELEGHTGLRLVSQPRNIDIIVNWGVFDFASPGFVYRFVKGETDYMAGAAPSRSFIDAYAADGRWVREQVLNLTPAQASRLVALVEENLRPENRVYRYNYVADNCATRPFALVERAVADSIALGYAEPAIDGARSFRDAMRHYHRNYPWYQFGIDLALGSTIDRSESRRAMIFSPLALSQMTDSATLPGGEPLALGAVMLVAGREGGVAAGPTPWYLTPAAVAWLMLLVTLLVTLWDLASGRLSRGFDAVFYTVLGLAGCLITFLVFFSVHGPASPNWLLLWLNPLCLLPVILIWTKRGRNLLMWWQMINFVALICMCVVWIAGIQACNSAFIPLVISDGVRSLFFIFYNRCSTPQSRRRRPMVYHSSTPAAYSVR